jgi:hypothetical protein
MFIIGYLIAGIIVAGLAMFYGLGKDWRQMKEYYSHWKSWRNALVLIAIWPVTFVVLLEYIWYEIT